MHLSNLIKENKSKMEKRLAESLRDTVGRDER